MRMMIIKGLFMKMKLIFLFSILLSAAYAANSLDHTVSGDEEIEDVLNSAIIEEDSPFITGGQNKESVDNKKVKGEDFVFPKDKKIVEDAKIDPKKEFEDFGYTLPGTFENSTNFLETDRKKMAKGYRENSNGGINITFLKNSFDYQSPNNVINRTVETGPGSIKGGALYVRHDSAVFKTMVLEGHFSVGVGLGYNAGKGIFVDGTRSDADFKLWEAPVDVGVGLEIPISSWFKIAGTGGGSVMTLLQNRSDFEKGEKGKRKFQFSPGYFVNAQFKINLSGFSEDSSYELFTESQITNLFLNLEGRMQNYSGFKDNISISGSSFGIGFTFEYL
jgi:hypothetical protein